MSSPEQMFIGFQLEVDRIVEASRSVTGSVRLLAESVDELQSEVQRFNDSEELKREATR